MSSMTVMMECMDGLIGSVVMLTARLHVDGYRRKALDRLDLRPAPQLALARPVTQNRAQSVSSN